MLAGRAEELAIASVSETGLGNVADKALKIRFASLGVYGSFAGQVAQGVLSVDAERRVTEIASPVGVVFAVAPVTNPVATAIFKMLIAIKGRNALILSFHHQALGVGRLTCRHRARRVEGPRRAGRSGAMGGPAESKSDAAVHGTSGRVARARHRRPVARGSRLQLRHAGDRRRTGQRAGLDLPGRRPR